MLLNVSHFHFILKSQEFIIFLQVAPWSMRGLLRWVSKTYNKVPIIITENGISDTNSDLVDDFRIDQLKVSVYKTWY